MYADVQGTRDDPTRGLLAVHACSGTQYLRANCLSCGRGSGLSDGYGRESGRMEEPRRGSKSKGTKQTKGRRVRTVGTRTKSKRKQKPWWGKKGSRNVVQGKGTVTTDGASSSGSVAAVASGTNTQGQKNQNQQKKGPQRKFPCPGCGDKHQFKDCPQWKSVQALLAKEKKPGN